MFNGLLIPIMSGAALFATLLSPSAAAQKKEPPPCITKHRGESTALPDHLFLYEHKVYLTNGCKNTVKVRVCYKDTKTCVLPEVAPGKERMTRLGTKRGEPRFEYTFVVQPIGQPEKKKQQEKKKQEKK